MAEHARNHCTDGGWVVGARPLPTDPHDHDGERAPIRGCTNLFCTFCQQQVRSAPNCTLVQPRPDVDSHALFRCAELPSSPLVTHSLTTRLYTCACLTHLASSQQPLVDPDPSSAIQPATQWRCGGHPVVSLPHVFDGWSVTTDNLPEIALQALAGELPPAASEMDRPRARWLARLATRLAGTDRVPVLASAVAAHLTADDLGVRVGAIQFFLHVPSQRGVVPFAALLSEHARAFVGIRDPHAEVKGDTTLEHVLWRLALARIPTDHALRDVALRAAADPARVSRSLLMALRHAEPNWFREHAVALARASPTLVPDLIDACPRQLESGAVLAELRAMQR